MTAISPGRRPVNEEEVHSLPRQTEKNHALHCLNQAFLSIRNALQGWRQTKWSKNKLFKSIALNDIRAVNQRLIGSSRSISFSWNWILRVFWHLCVRLQRHIVLWIKTHLKYTHRDWDIHCWLFVKKTSHVLRMSLCLLYIQKNLNSMKLNERRSQEPWSRTVLEETQCQRIQYELFCQIKHVP